MEKKTMGTFLAALRKANGMTQQEVADILNVSNKTISKWERDDGCPEIMMLPAIAELYNITVDELLKGERIANSENSDTAKDIKTEKRAKYIFDRSLTKYTNYSIISMVLGAAAVIFTFIMGLFGSLIPCIFAIAFLAASIIIEGIAFNSFFSSIKSDSIEIAADALNKSKKKAALFLSVTISLAVSVVLLSVIILILNLHFYNALAFVLGILSITIIHPVICKKLGIKDLGLSAEFKAYRKKHIKITAIIAALTVFASAILNFAVAAIGFNPERSFGFTHGVGYQYETKEEAINDYFKMKNYFENRQKLYTLISEHPTENGYRIYVDEIHVVFTENEDGYQITNEYDVDWSDEQEIDFENYEQAEKFIKENVIDYHNTFAGLKKDIRFDDNTYTVYYKINQTYLGYSLDTLFVFVAVGAGIAAVEAVISSIVYFSKKKK